MVRKLLVVLLLLPVVALPVERIVYFNFGQVAAGVAGWLAAIGIGIAVFRLMRGPREPSDITCAAKVRPLLAAPWTDWLPSLRSGRDARVATGPVSASPNIIAGPVMGRIGSNRALQP